MRIYCLTLFSFLACAGLYGQVPTVNRMLNFGQSQPQASETLPVSRSSSRGELHRTASPFSPARLVACGGNSWKIVSGWKMQSAPEAEKSGILPFLDDYDTVDWYDATVPGTVLTTLVDCGVFPDPYYGLNNMEIPDTLCRTDWWYRVEVEVPDEIRGTRATLVLNGINYRADVWFNSVRLGRVSGAFIRGEFDVSGLVRRGRRNILAVRIMPPDNPGIPHEASVAAGMGRNGGVMCLDGPTFFASEGWDWMPSIRDRNIGIWQDVQLRFHGDVTIGDPQVVSDLPLPDTTSAKITFRIPLRNISSSEVDADVHLGFGGISICRTVRLEAGSEAEAVFSPEEYPELEVKNPELWWPNGMGRQNLCSADITVMCGGGTSDTRKVRFGIREYEYVFRVADRDGEEYDVKFNPTEAYGFSPVIFDNVNVKRTKAFRSEHFLPRLLCGPDVPGIERVEYSSSPHIIVRINGRDVFCRGGNWGMDDAMKRVSRERLEPYFRLHKFQNFNMIRNWAGQSTEEVFYELCDEYGMMVFNDFWMSTMTFNLPPADNGLFMDNATDVVLRYRNHPSIALWCARNEGFAPRELEARLSSMLAVKDGTRHYLPSSININTGVSGPWNNFMPETYSDPEYYRSAYGFRSEIGYSSVPTFRTLSEFMEPEDMWPMGDVWSYHDWHSNGWPDFDKYAGTLSEMYGRFSDAIEFCTWSQIENYRAWRAIFESWNGRLWNDATGILIWMSHPAWPSTVWQTYTYDYETTGAYYASRKACEPEHIQMNLSTGLVQIVNLTAGEREYMAKYDIYSPGGDELASGETVLSVGPDSIEDWCSIGDSLHDTLKMVRLSLYSKSGKLVSTNDYWVEKRNKPDYRLLRKLAPADVRVVRTVSGKDGNVRIILKNISRNMALGVRMGLCRKSDGSYVRPALFSDGFFHMLPGEEREIILYECRDFARKYSLSVDWNNRNK